MYPAYNLLFTFAVSHYIRAVVNKTRDPASCRWLNIGKLSMRSPSGASIIPFNPKEKKYIHTQSFSSRSQHNITLILLFKFSLWPISVMYTDNKTHLSSCAISFSSFYTPGSRAWISSMLISLHEDVDAAEDMSRFGFCQKSVLIFTLTSWTAHTEFFLSLFQFWFMYQNFTRQVSQPAWIILWLGLTKLFIVITILDRDTAEYCVAWIVLSEIVYRLRDVYTLCKAK